MEAHSGQHDRFEHRSRGRRSRDHVASLAGELPTEHFSRAVGRHSAQRVAQQHASHTRRRIGAPGRDRPVDVVARHLDVLGHLLGRAY